MNILTEIWTSKLPRRVIKWIMTPADHERPQDDVPDETILRHLNADYRKMLHERLTLIAYIRKLENIYKNAQMGIFQMAVSDNPPTRKRMVKNLRLLAYNLTKEHIAAQKQLREMLGETTEETQPTRVGSETDRNINHIY